MPLVGNVDALLERHREYLRLLARLSVPRRLAAKVDASDIVQQTLMKAHAAVPEFRGGSEEELAAWLRQILQHEVAHLVRDLRRTKRDARREVALGAPAGSPDQTSRRLESLLAADQTSPSMAAVRHERVLRMAQALSQLPDGQRDAVTLHYLKGLSISQVAAELDKSLAATAGLLQRGLRELRRLMDEART